MTTAGTAPPKNPIAAHPLISAIVTILVGGSVLSGLIVPIYASVTPKIGAWPFFYFYLLVCTPLVAIALGVAGLLQRRLPSSLRATDETVEGTE